jgi:hypothetical protein
MLTKEEREAYEDRVAARKLYWAAVHGALPTVPSQKGSSEPFAYPTRFEGNAAIITVHKTFQRGQAQDRDYDVIVDLDVYNRLRSENRRLFIHPYIGGKWHRHENVLRVMVSMPETHADGGWALAWFALGKRGQIGLMADHINGDDLDNRKKNLRWVTHEQNMQNRAGWNKYSRHAGVSFNKGTDKWVASVQRSFDTLEEAESFSDEMHQIAFGEFARRLDVSPSHVTGSEEQGQPESTGQNHDRYWWAHLKHPIHWEGGETGPVPAQMHTLAGINNPTETKAPPPQSPVEWSGMKHDKSPPKKPKNTVHSDGLPHRLIHWEV